MDDPRLVTIVSDLAMLVLYMFAMYAPIAVGIKVHEKWKERKLNKKQSTPQVAIKPSVDEEHFSNFIKELEVDYHCLIGDRKDVAPQGGVKLSSV